MYLEYKIKPQDMYQTVNEVLINELKISTRLLNKLIKMKKIYLNNEFVDTRSPIKSNDIITVYLDYEEDNSNIVPTEMDLNIIYEDDWFLIIDKPAGIAIHPSCMHYSTSLSNGVRFYFDKIGLHKKIRPVNRLDFGTSGLVVFAKCEYIQESFIKQMENNQFIKEYLCLTERIFKEKSGIIDLPIARKSGSIIERCVDISGQKAVTHYEVLKEFENYSLVQCLLKTGRTHQIRVHMAAISHPLLGDTLYGHPSEQFPYQALHSYKIQCVHPINNEKMTFISKFEYLNLHFM